MPVWSRTELEAYERRRRGEKYSIPPYTTTVPAVHPQPTQGSALERSLPRETTSGHRLTIRFTVYAVRPPDWDGIDVKYLQDLLIQAGIISSDQWDSLQGEVRSEKVDSKQNEKTVIEIF